MAAAVDQSGVALTPLLAVIFLKLAVAGHLSPLWRARGADPDQTVSCADPAGDTKVPVTLFVAYGFGLAVPVSWPMIGFVWA